MKNNHQSYIRPRRSRYGVSTFDIVLTLGIIAVISAGVLGIFRGLQINWMQTQTYNMVNEIKLAVHDVHRASTRYAGYSDTNPNILPILYQAKLLPDGFYEGTGEDVKLFTPFGNNVRVEASEDGRSFIITIEKFKRGNCINFVSRYMGKNFDREGIKHFRSGPATTRVQNSDGEYVTRRKIGFTEHITLSNIAPGCASHLSWFNSIKTVAPTTKNHDLVIEFE